MKWLLLELHIQTPHRDNNIDTTVVSEAGGLWVVTSRVCVCAPQTSDIPRCQLKPQPFLSSSGSFPQTRRLWPVGQQITNTAELHVPQPEGYIPPNHPKYPRTPLKVHSLRRALLPGLDDLPSPPCTQARQAHPASLLVANVCSCAPSPACSSMSLCVLVATYCPRICPTLAKYLVNQMSRFDHFFPFVVSL